MNPQTKTNASTSGEFKINLLTKRTAIIAAIVISAAGSGVWFATKHVVTLLESATRDTIREIVKEELVVAVKERESIIDQWLERDCEELSKPKPSYHYKCPTPTWRR